MRCCNQAHHHYGLTYIWIEVCYRLDKIFDQFTLTWIFLCIAPSMGPHFFLSKYVFTTGFPGFLCPLLHQSEESRLVQWYSPLFFFMRYLCLFIHSNIPKRTICLNVPSFAKLMMVSLVLLLA
jgi:hypothetical protein